MAAAVTPPGRITVIAPGDDAVGVFLRPRPVAALPGIGPATARTLSRYGITTIGQLADTSEGVLARILGKQAGRELAARARGNDDRPVQRTALIRSTSASHNFDRDELDPDAHRRALLALADELGARLRTSHEVCRGLTLTVRYADRTTRSRALPEPSAHPPALAYSLYTSLGLERARVRQLTMRADQLGPDETAHHQLRLDDGDDKARRIEAVTDAARSRFGPHVITAATLATRGGHPRKPS
ncbi:DNA polymerase Y family protein [Streptomyces sp. NPDC055092]